MLDIGCQESVEWDDGFGLERWNGMWNGILE